MFAPEPSQVGYGSQVALSALAGATIHYTTNGTTPLVTSPIYTAPITVTGNITIYAKAFHIDWTTSPQSGGAYTVKVGTPIFSPDAGSYAPGQLVSVTDTTPNAVVHYTTNGTDPTEADPVIGTGSTVVAGNFVLKARAFIPGWTTSDIASASYVLTAPLANWAVAGGREHSVALKNDGTVWTWGRNYGGALGDETTGRSTAAVVNGVTGVVAISAGAYHSLALRSNGTVWAWGTNGNGQLGDDTTTSRSAFALVTGLSSVSAISAGSSFSVALENDGTVWAWGDNSAGQLGDGTVIQRTAPIQVPGLTGIVAVATGNDFTLARKSDGTIWGWGNNASGQLGDGTTTARTSPVQASGIIASAGPWAGYAHALAATSAGVLYAWGLNGSGQLGTGGGSSTTPVAVAGVAVVAMADGAFHSIVRASDSTVWTWGSNSSGQLGDGTTSTRTTPYQVAGLADIAAVAAGQNHSLVVTSDGSVWSWGHNDFGELGDGTLNDRLVPVQISEANFNWKTATPRLSPDAGTYSVVTNVAVTSVTSGAEIHYTTNGIDPALTDPTVSGGVVVVDETMTLKAAAWAAGKPPSNVATAAYAMVLPAPAISPATGTYTAAPTITMTCGVPGAAIRYTADGSEPTETSAIYTSSFLVDASATIKAQAFKSGWANGPVTTRTYTLKVALPAFSPSGGGFGAPQAVTISTSTPTAVIRYTENGAEPTAASPVYTAPVSVTSTTTLKAAASRAGWVDSDSSAASFWITQGSVDTPSFAPAGGSLTPPVDVAIATAASGATIRYTVDGSDPTPLSRTYVGPITLFATTTIKARAYKPGYMPSVIASASYAVDAAGAVDTPTLTPGGGWSTAQQIVTISVQAPSATIHYTTTGADPVETDPVITSGAILAVDRSMVVKAKAWSASLAPSGVRRADYVITGAIVVGSSSSYALKSDGTVWAWGSNASGQLGDGTYAGHLTPQQVYGLTDIVAIAAGATHALAVKSDGTVWAWGANAWGQLGDGTTSARLVPTQVAGVAGAISVAAGELHSLALKADGSVWAWGANDSGQLGDGTTTAHYVPVVVPALTGVSRLAAGRRFSLAVEDDGTGSGGVWAWGANDEGQLGDGSTLPRTSPVLVLLTTQTIAIAAGQDFAFAITRDGTLWAWGRNGNGQLGDATNTDRLVPVPIIFAAGVSSISAGQFHSAAATNDGRVWTWGSNAWDQLGDDASDRNYPQTIGGVAGALMIASAPTAIHTIALQPDGTVVAWGNNASGQIGDGTTTIRPTPVGVSGMVLATNTWLLDDFDQDGLITWREYLIGTDPLTEDTNRDGLRDGTAVAASVSPIDADVDGDAVPNWIEIAQGTNPFSADTDGDTVPDSVDCFPLDATRSACLPSDPNDHTPPVITLIEPVSARRIP